MIGHLRGSIHRLDVGEIQIDVSGVGYRLTTPLETWESLPEGEPAMVWVSTYIREDRHDLYGFRDRAGRTLFEEFLKLDGIGPRLALELCSVPRSLLLQAATQKDSSILNEIKGIGKMNISLYYNRNFEVRGGLSWRGRFRRIRGFRGIYYDSCLHPPDTSDTSDSSLPM